MTILYTTQATSDLDRYTPLNIICMRLYSNFGVLATKAPKWQKTYIKQQLECVLCLLPAAGLATNNLLVTYKMMCLKGVDRVKPLCSSRPVSPQNCAESVGCKQTKYGAILVHLAPSTKVWGPRRDDLNEEKRPEFRSPPTHAREFVILTEMDIIKT